MTNDGYLNTYQIDSKFGTFTAVSTAVLRKRIGEINAMVVMEKVQDSKEYIASFKEAGLDAMTSAMSLVTSPVQTLSGAVQGLGAAFERVGGTLFGAERSGSEDARIKDAIGFAATKREYAYQFGVDVYSENQKMQDMLNKISWAGYAGSLTWSAAMAAVPGGAGIAMTVVGSNKLLNQVFQNTPPVALRKMNTEKLNAMGVNPEITDAFINNTIFSPREQTLLVHALGEMNGVADRGALVRLALPSQNSDGGFIPPAPSADVRRLQQVRDAVGEFHFLGSICLGPYTERRFGFRFSGGLRGLDSADGQVDHERESGRQ